MNILLQWIAGIVARVVRTLDFWLMLPLLALMVIGLAVLHSAGGQDMHLVYAQGARFAVGLAALWLLSRLAPMRLRGIAPVLFGLSLVPLLLVLPFGTGEHGRHWLNLGLFYF